MDTSEEIIFANSQIRPLLINKEEYYLCYTHNDLNIQAITNSINERSSLACNTGISSIRANNSNPTIGKIDIFGKKPEDKKYFKFTSNGESNTNYISFGYALLQIFKQK